MQLQKIGSLDAAYREERHTELCCPQLLNKRMAAGIVHFREAFLADTPEVRRHAEILFKSNIGFLHHTDSACATKQIHVHAWAVPTTCRSRRPCRISSRRKATGSRQDRPPPTAIVIPSCTMAAASASDTCFCSEVKIDIACPFYHDNKTYLTIQPPSITSMCPVT